MGEGNDMDFDQGDSLAWVIHMRHTTHETTLKIYACYFM